MHRMLMLNNAKVINYLEVRVMKRTILIAFMVLSCFFMHGCFETVPIQPEIQTKNILIKPSSDMTKDCEAGPTPPNKQQYLAATAKEKEKLLHDHIVSLYATLHSCNNRWVVLRQWYDKQEQLLSSTSPNNHE